MTSLEEYEQDLASLGSLKGVGEFTDALNHDVGKYIARIAKNVSRDATTLAPTLLAMLIKDLYETHRGLPASVRFTTLRASLPEPVRASRIVQDVATRLAVIDALQASVRAGDINAAHEAMRQSLCIERHLSDIARATRRVCNARGDDA